MEMPDNDPNKKTNQSAKTSKKKRTQNTPKQNKNSPQQPEKRKLLYGLVGLAATTAVGAGVAYEATKAPERPKPLKEEIMSFTWSDLENPEKFNKLVDRLAVEYLNLTKSPRVTKNDLINPEITNFHRSRNAHVTAVRQTDSTYSPTGTQWGYTHFDSGKVFIDLDTLKKLSMQEGGNAGMAIIDALWHEWGHKDITIRTQGKLLNDPRYVFFSPNSQKNEEFRKYRGVEVFTDTFYGFLRMEEVIRETITVRRMIEQVGLTSVVSARDYYQNGVDIFVPFTKKFISVDDLYNMDATSDFEGIATLVGKNLPRTGDDLAKGAQLFLGIHTMNPTIIAQTGILEKI